MSLHGYRLASQIEDDGFERVHGHRPGENWQACRLCSESRRMDAIRERLSPEGQHNNAGCVSAYRRNRA